MMLSPNKNLVCFASLLGVFVVGWIDYITGTEIRVYPLYFIPIIIASYSGGRWCALFISFASSVAWLDAMYFSADEHMSSLVLTINYFVQMVVFAFVGVLVANIAAGLVRERELGMKDYLTGLFNSRAFYENASQMLADCATNAKPVTVAFMDLDNFKQANDSWGHLQGDALLKEAARIIRAAVREGDVIARMGGDEFAMVLPAPAREAGVILERIRQALAESPEMKRSAVTASIGAVSCARVTQGLDSMISMADRLMYEVKARGKNRLEVRDMQ